MLVFEDDRCKSCGICVGFCPQKCLKITNKINNKGYKVAGLTDEDKCTACGTCFHMCPDVAITVYRKSAS